MRVALPICRGRISPVFDVARSIRVIDVDHRTVISRSDLIAQSEHTTVLVEHGVKLLICAGITREMEDHLRARGIEVISGICGPVNEVVEAYAAGRLGNGRFTMPGGSCPRRRRGRRSQITGNGWKGGAPQRTRSGK